MPKILNMLKKKEETVPEAKEEPKPEVKKKVVNTEVWKVGKVATQTADVFYNESTEEQLDINEALCMILNKLEHIESYLA